MARCVARRRDRLNAGHDLIAIFNQRQTIFERRQLGSRRSADGLDENRRDLERCRGHAGQAEAGLAVIVDALAVIEQTGERWYEAELHRLNGELRWQASASEVEVETLFQRARSVAQQQQAKSLELRATMSLGRLWHNQGRGSAAHTLLTEVYDWFSEGLDTPDLREAAALLAAWV
jgi:predicted ATPase